MLASGMMPSDGSTLPTKVEGAFYVAERAFEAKYDFFAPSPLSTPAKAQVTVTTGYPAKPKAAAKAAKAAPASAKAAPAPAKAAAPPADFSE